MKSLIRLTDYTPEDIFEIFTLADEISEGKYADFLKGKSVVLFFPNSKISAVMGFDLVQCCGKGYEMDGVNAKAIMEMANEEAVLNPCPPFTEAKKCLMM